MGMNLWPLDFFLSAPQKRKDCQSLLFSLLKDSHIFSHQAITLVAIVSGVANQTSNSTSSKAGGGLSPPLYKETLQSFTPDAHFKVIAVLSNGASVRAQMSSSEFIAHCSNFIGNKSL
jgi:hypothetical protein